MTEQYLLSSDNSMAYWLPNISEKFAIKKADNIAEQMSVMKNQNIKKISVDIEKNLKIYKN